MKNKFLIFIAMLVACVVMMDGCSPCFRATKLRHKAAKKSGAERHKLEGQAASLEAACLKKRDEKYDTRMQKQFEDMEKKARN